MADAEKQIKAAFRSLTKKIVRKRIVDEGVRIDGRGPTDIRPLSAEVGVLPTVHGSGLFQRGETQVLNVTTLGMPRMEQMLDTLEHRSTRKRYMHHYNFPPFSTGETGFMRGPKRREIGHGMLAERALVPGAAQPRTSSPTRSAPSPRCCRPTAPPRWARSARSTLSLMDAGVPIKAPVAGIAMGLVFAEGKYTTLTDILGAEDAFGDMDFKVAGTAEFVTALQLDTKIDGIPADVLGQALEQAKEARLAILEVMHGAIAEPRAEVGATAPKIISFEIPIDKIGEVIGPKGKVINAIQQETGADISVDDDGMVGTGQHRLDRLAVRSPRPSARSSSSSTRRPPRSAQTYPGRVVNITKFGAFVNILPGRDGLLHISKLGGGKRIDRVEDVLDLGDEVEVRGRRRRPERQGLALAWSTPSGSTIGVRRAPAARRPSVRAQRRRAATATTTAAAPTASTSRSRTPSTSEIRDEFGDLGPEPAGGRRRRRAVAAAAVERRPQRRRWPRRSGGGRRSAADADGELRGATSRRPTPAHRRRPSIDTTLAYGLRVVTERMPEARRSAIGVWVGVGSRDEPDELAGASHFLEHLLFKGTEERSARSIADGGRRRRRRDERLHDARAHGVLHAGCPSAQLGFGLDLLADVVARPGVPARRGRRRARGHPRRAPHERGRARRRAAHALCEALFPGHPLGPRDARHRGHRSRRWPATTIAEFHARSSTGPANLVVVAAGDLDHDAVVDGRRPAASPAAERGRRARAHRAADRARAAGASSHRPDRAGARRHRAGGRCTTTTPTATPSAVANQVLGGGMSSRLFQEIREERGLAYTVYSSPSSYSATAARGRSYAGTAPEAPGRGARASSTTSSTGSLADGITEEEHEVAVGYLEGSMLLGLEDTGSRMARLGGEHDRPATRSSRSTSTSTASGRSRSTTSPACCDRVFAGPRTVAAVGPFDDDEPTPRRRRRPPPKLTFAVRPPDAGNHVLLWPRRPSGRRGRSGFARAHPLRNGPLPVPAARTRDGATAANSRPRRPSAAWSLASTSTVTVPSSSRRPTAINRPPAAVICCGSIEKQSRAWTR